ncbi:MAG: tryptophan-rich sensory protein [Flavobacteriales bacterium]|nr:tryptophan-rich sensory protein [Flavobacteriales bacterium]
MTIKIIIFLFINFAALGLGGLFTSGAVSGDWYQNLNKAPWTPPGWVFGTAWTSIMICFAIYMAYAWQNIHNKNTLMLLFALQWILNVSWNPLFFKYHQVVIGLLVIVSLTLLVGYLFFAYFHQLKIKSLLLLPYVVWMLIATSLNTYIFFKN